MIDELAGTTNMRNFSKYEDRQDLITNDYPFHPIHSFIHSLPPVQNRYRLLDYYILQRLAIEVNRIYREREISYDITQPTMRLMWAVYILCSYETPVIFR